MWKLWGNKFIINHDFLLMKYHSEKEVFWNFLIIRLQGRSYWGVGGTGGSCPLLQFPNRTRSVSVWDIKHLTFYGCSEIIRSRHFTIIIAYATSFGQFTATFHFSNYIGEKDHFTLDLMKRSDTWRWNFWKVSCCRPPKRRSQWTRV